MVEDKNTKSVQYLLFKEVLDEYRTSKCPKVRSKVLLYNAPMTLWAPANPI